MNSLMLYWLLVKSAKEIEEWYAQTSIAGLLILLFIEGPVLILILASLLGKPRRLTPVGLTLGLFALVLGSLIVGSFVLSGILGVIVPLR